MQVPIYRALAFVPQRDLTPDPDSEPFAMFSFSPIEPDDPRMLIGSGPFPWCFIDVPAGSRIAFDALFLPGSTEPLHPSQVLERFKPVNNHSVPVSRSRLSARQAGL